MTVRNGSEPVSGPTIDVIRRRDVENYAARHPQDDETVRRVEQALLDDDAARDLIREGLWDSGDSPGARQTRGLLFEPLHDLGEAVTRCRLHGDLYEQLHPQMKGSAARHFAEGRRWAFHAAADRLAEPLRAQRPSIRSGNRKEAALLGPEDARRLARRLCDSPAAALGSLAELHRPLMQDLRSLILLPWPMAIKLLIADSYAELREELESGAWHLPRQMEMKARSGRHALNQHK